MKRFILTNHICRNCGGRILQQTNSGPTGGGNPIYMCADCEQTSCGISPNGICWCGFKMRGQSIEPYMCLPFSGNENLKEEFAKCGCDINSNKSRIGIVRNNIC